MLRIIGLNIDKKFSIFSTIFMFVSVLLIYLICYLNASFDLKEFDTLINYDLLNEIYLCESLELIELITVIFIILLVQMDLFYNTNNFDAYFVSLVGKRKYFFVKIISYLMMIFMFVTTVFVGFLIIYLIRFKSVLYLPLIIESFFKYFFYFVMIFSISFFFLTLFNNYFSAFFIFLYFWLSKLIENNNQITEILFPKVIINIEEAAINFSCNFLVVIFWILSFIYLSKKLYEFNDLKINS